MATGLQRVELRNSGIPTLAPALRGFLEAAAAPPVETVDAAARRYIGHLFGNDSTDSFNAARSMFEAAPAGPAGPAQATPDLEYRGVEEVALTQNQVASYSQSYRGIPVYGARVGVEMSAAKELRSIAGYVGNPVNVDPIATLSPAEATRVVKEVAGLKPYEPLPIGNAPELNFFYDERKAQWSLVYLFNNVALREAAPAGDHAENDADRDAEHDGAHSHFMSTYKVMIDAHSGELVARIPLRKVLNPMAASGSDADGVLHQFSATQLAAGNFILEDPVRKIRTQTMNFNDIFCDPLSLPGVPVESNSAVFQHPSAVVAHANATRVYDFMLGTLQRNGIDNLGMWIISCVDCLNYRASFGFCGPHDPLRRIYRNAMWIMFNPPAAAELRRGIMVYGQTEWPGGNLHSYAESLDVVAHELTHGVTSYTCDLDYELEHGAMNESYSDILGVAISNADLGSLAAWNWEIGEELSATGNPTRDISDPMRFGDPDHMNNYMALNPGQLPNQSNDFGNVHSNSGIHNKAAFNLFSSGLFTWQEVVQMYYLTLSTPGRLSNRSTFADSKAGMLLSCESLLPNAPDLQQKLAAIRQAFDDVGVL